MNKSIFMVGDNVYHKQFGEGFVIKIVDDRFVNVKFKELLTFRTINAEKLTNLSVRLGIL